MNKARFYSLLALNFCCKSKGHGFLSRFLIKLNLLILVLLVGPSWLMSSWTKQLIIEISLVLFADLVVFKLNEREVIGGEALLISSIVIPTSFGDKMKASCLHQVCLNCFYFWTFLMVNQHGPLIFLFNKNSSSMLWLAPKMVSKVFPVKFAGSGGFSAGYLIFKNLCSPWLIGISKQYFLETNLHLKPDIFLNLFFLKLLNSITILCWIAASSSSLNDPLALLAFIFGRANKVLSIPLT